MADSVPALAFAVLMTLSSIGPEKARGMSHPVARWLGDVSYGVFLWHFPFVLVYMRVLGWVEGIGDGPFFSLVALILPSSLVCGWLSRRWVEDPAIRFARRA